MADPQASLRALLGGGSNIANSRVALRNKQLEDPRTSDPFRRMVMGENADEAAAQAQDPMAQKYRAISEGQASADVANDPRIKAEHDVSMAEKLALATAPARTAGEFNVKAAETAGRARGEAVAQAQDARTALAAQTQGAKQAQTGQSQRNASLEGQAKTAEKSSRNLFQLLLPNGYGGQPSGASRAAALRAQQTYGAPSAPSGGGGSNVAQQLHTEFADATPDQVAAYAQQELGMSDPADVANLVASYQALQGR